MAAAALPTVIRRLAITCLLVVMGLLAILWGATPDYGDVATQTTQSTDTIAPTMRPRRFRRPVRGAAVKLVSTPRPASQANSTPWASSSEHIRIS